MKVRLLRAGSREVLRESTTNSDGRCDSPLLEGEALVTGQYILAFEIAPYFRQRGANLPNPPFLDTVELAFGISDPTVHHHIPLLVSPWSYSTYRGS